MRRRRQTGFFDSDGLRNYRAFLLECSDSMTLILCQKAEATTLPNPLDFNSSHQILTADGWIVSHLYLVLETSGKDHVCYLLLPLIGVEYLPVEVIGVILSHLRAARDVVVASATCKKWREAFQYHLHSLTFFGGDWPIYCDLTSDRLKAIITQTILQTKGLRYLSFCLRYCEELTTDDVFPWLMHVRDTLCELYLYANIYPTIKILEKCNGQKLEVLELAYIYISSEECSYQKFPCLKTLRLECVVVSLLDLSILLTLCPKIENLTLVDLGIRLGAPPQTTWVLSTVSLKTINVSELDLDKFILEADSLEYLHLLMCTFEHFKFVGKGALKVLNMDASRISYFDIGDMEKLEIVDVNDCTIKGPKLYNMISKSSNLRRLRLWHVKFNNANEVIGLERISASFPQLTHLSLHYDVEETLFSLQGSFHLQNVAVLELGCPIYRHLSGWIAGVLERCPNLKKIDIYVFVCKGRISEDLQLPAEFSTAIFQIARNHPQVEFQFKYE